MSDNSEILDLKRFWRVMVPVAALNGALAVFGYILLHGVIGWHHSADSVGAILALLETLLFYLIIIAVDATILRKLYGMKLISLLLRRKRLTVDADFEKLAGMCVAGVTGILILVAVRSVPGGAEVLSPANGIDLLPVLIALLLPTAFVAVPAIIYGERAREARGDADGAGA